MICFLYGLSLVGFFHIPLSETIDTQYNRVYPAPVIRTPGVVMVTGSVGHRIHNV